MTSVSVDEYVDGHHFSMEANPELSPLLFTEPDLIRVRRAPPEILDELLKLSLGLRVINPEGGLAPADGTGPSTDFAKQPLLDDPKGERVEEIIECEVLRN